MARRSSAASNFSEPAELPLSRSLLYVAFARVGKDWVWRLSRARRADESCGSGRPFRGREVERLEPQFVEDDDVSGRAGTWCGLLADAAPGFSRPASSRSSSIGARSGAIPSPFEAAQRAETADKFPRRGSGEPGRAAPGSRRMVGGGPSGF